MRGLALVGLAACEVSGGATNETGLEADECADPELSEFAEEYASVLCQHNVACADEGTDTGAAFGDCVYLSTGYHEDHYAGRGYNPCAAQACLDAWAAVEPGCVRELDPAVDAACDKDVISPEE